MLFGDALTTLSSVFVDATTIYCTLEAVVVGGPPQDCRAWIVGPLIQSVPFVIRGWQCFVVFRLSGTRSQLINLLKYVSVLPVIWLSAAKHGSSFVHDTADERDYPLLNAWFVAVIFNTLLSFIWDTWMDWGLGWAWPGQTVAPLLRPKLLLGRPWLYYSSLVFNLVLRMTWSLRLSSHLQQRATGAAFGLFFQLLEISRRFVWNFIRVEWECISKNITPAPENDDKPRQPNRTASPK